VNTWDAVTVCPSPPEHEPTSTIIVSAGRAGVTGTAGTLARSFLAGPTWEETPSLSLCIVAQGRKAVTVGGFTL
jgi:hypothetical protein